MASNQSSRPRGTCFSEDEVKILDMRLEEATVYPDTLRTFKAKATYYHDRKYGGTLAYFSTTGSADSGLYGTDSDGNAMRPDSKGWIAELDYLPIQNVRLMLQYTAYNKFNGASTNYDGNGRNASDNNTLFFNVWVAF